MFHHCQLRSNEKRISPTVYTDREALGKEAVRRTVRWEFRAVGWLEQLPICPIASTYLTSESIACGVLFFWKRSDNKQSDSGNGRSLIDTICCPHKSSYIKHQHQPNLSAGGASCIKCVGILCGGNLCFTHGAVGKIKHTLNQLHFSCG